MSKIAVITDMDVVGSGYKYVMAPLLDGLAALGHQIQVAGLNYNGIEHPYKFSIIPCRDVQDTVGVVNNLHYMWQPDVFMVGMDIPLQLAIHQTLSQFQKPYIAITPLENGPLTMSWAAGLFNMSHIFFISELGKQEANKAGLSNADHLLVGVDTEAWRPALPEERKTIRQNLGIEEDEFVILSVGDNQERKNLASALEIVSKLKEDCDRKIRFILVTREQSPFGWKLRDLAVRLNINKELNIYERGMTRENLWGLYAVADAYLCTSKAEGLGLPVLDAMAAGVPVVATDTGALHELLEDDRGYLVPPEYVIRHDVWGNSTRSMISVEYATGALFSLERGGYEAREIKVKNALEYIQKRTWEVAVNQVNNVIRKLTHANSEQQEGPH